MKFLIAVLLTMLLAFAFGLFLPWWSIAIAAFIVSALITQRPLIAFLTGFIGLFLLWAVVAWMRDAGNEGILSKKVAGIIFQGESSFLLILITALIGGLVGGLGAFSGSLLARVRSMGYEVRSEEQ